MLDKYLNAADTFWTSLENKPLSLLSGLFQKRRGVRSGLPDLLVIWRAKPIFVEIKSRAGVASKAQKQICAKLKLAGADWYLARSARAALMALNLSAWCSGVNGSHRGSSLGRDRSRTRRCGCRRRRTWPHGDERHDGDGGRVSGYERPRNWQQRATMSRAVTSPHRAALERWVFKSQPTTNV